VIISKLFQLIPPLFQQFMSFSQSESNQEQGRFVPKRTKQAIYQKRVSKYTITHLQYLALRQFPLLHQRRHIRQQNTRDLLVSKTFARLRLENVSKSPNHLRCGFMTNPRCICRRCCCCAARTSSRACVVAHGRRRFSGQPKDNPDQQLHRCLPRRRGANIQYLTFINSRLYFMDISNILAAHAEK